MGDEEEEDSEDGDEAETSDEDEPMAEDKKAAEDGEASEGDEDEDEDEDEAVLLDDAESVDDDAVPQQKLEIDNQVALERIRQTIQLDPSLPWTETLALTYPEKIEVDVDDDLNRELAFYKQALHSAQAAQKLAAKHNFPFTRPSDYFAEMVKSDAHMERIRQRLLNESAGIKKSEEKRKEREGKKFGKQVQIEKQKEREKSKKDMDERLKNLKRKRKDMLDNTQGNDEDFDVAVEDAISDRPSKRNKGPEGKARIPRQARDKKYGFGGAGRRSKQNTKDSTDNFGPGAGRGKKGKGGDGGKGGKRQRPGKSRRMAARSKS
ncbi:eukaryotic rRNA processing [Macrolepiota fuliginosa MF-IS2]|uniref:Eukaryotic rRNA processing n=1 Tax=Macrolepiota fuliginosa MF-IS2 TaxID=1400762 RepID=A0A9P6BZE5_9AGAR|nr:eukaryotic rRNA processing [Macrolepiota fuliginosa MF-IS2]